jgi:hypothetical protein
MSTEMQMSDFASAPPKRDNLKEIYESTKVKRREKVKGMRNVMR